MSGTAVPSTSTRCNGSMVASADQLATQAGMAILALGGNAVDAAIATNAALAVTAPHLCGMGGDLYALVHDGATVHALNASGRAGSGSDAGATPMRFVRALVIALCAASAHAIMVRRAARDSGRTVCAGC